MNSAYSRLTDKVSNTKQAICGFLKFVADCLQLYWQTYRKDNTFISLGPMTNDPSVFKKNHAQCKQLKHAISSKNRLVHNIAISGPYGAGKSSFLHSFQRYYPNKYLNISLATFIESARELADNGEVHQINKDGGKSASLIAKLTEKEIEESIVQHILYKEHPSEIPAISHRRLPLSTIRFKFGFTFLYAHAGLAVTYLFFVAQKTPSKFAIELMSITESLTTHPIELALLFVILGLIPFMFQCAHWFSTFDFRRLFAKDGKLTVADDSSPLNKHLEEIICFFHKTKYQVVVFEDLDRFCNVAIFTKLREINHLINQCEYIKQEVKFVYAVRDDLLSAKERTKFFELIIPILPIVHPNNAYGSLLQEFKRAQIESTQFDQFLLKSISQFIDDMRVLRNICLEFKNISLRLNNQIDNEATKILAMVIFKNLCPKEHAELLAGEGVLFEMFNQFRDIKIQEKLPLSKNISEIKSELEEIRSKALLSEQDLCRLYRAVFCEENNLNLDDLDSTYFSRQNIGRDGYLRKEKVAELIQHSNHHLNYIGAHFTISYAQIDKERNQPFSASIAAIEQGVIKLESELKNKQDKEAALLAMNFAEFMKAFSLEAIHSRVTGLDKNNKTVSWLKSNTKSSLACSFLLLHGFLAEDYADYLTEFVPGELTANDKNMLNQIAAGKQLDEYAEFTNLSAAVEAIDLRWLSSQRVLNYQLLGYLSNSMMNADDNAIKSLDIWQTLVFKNQIEPDYFLSFLQNMPEENQNVLPIAFKQSLKLVELTLKLLPLDLTLVSRILREVPECDILSLNSDLVFEIKRAVDHIEDLSLIQYDKIPYETLAALTISFERLDIAKVGLTGYLALLESGFFEPSFHMVCSFLNALCITKKMEKYELVNLKRIETLKVHFPREIALLNDCIENKLDAFLDKCLAAQSNYSEAEEHLIIAANGWPQDNAEKLIQLADTRIFALDQIDNKSMYGTLLGWWLVDANWKNVETLVNYLSDNDYIELKDLIIHFLSARETVEKLIANQEDISAVQYSQLIIDIIDENLMHPQSLDILLSNLPALDVEHGLNEKVLAKLVEHKLVGYSDEFFLTLESSSMLSTYIEQFPSPFIEQEDWNEYNIDFIISFVQSMKDNHLKIDCANKFLYEHTNPFSITFIPQFIIGLLNDLTDEELPLVKLNQSQLLTFFDSKHGLSNELKVRIITAYIPIKDWHEIKVLLSQSGEDSLMKFASNPNTLSLSDSPINHALINAFQKSGFIGKVKLISKGSRLLAYARPSKFKVTQEV